MPLIPWRPLWEIERWFEEWPEFEFPEIRTPRMDVYETENEVVAELEIPGVKPENINVEVKNNVLKVEAKEEEKKEVKEKGYFKREIGKRYFKRQILLPTEVIGEKAEAEYDNGILKIKIPKVKEKKREGKKIKVKVKK